jgi:hypothetical protein
MQPRTLDQIITELNQVYNPRIQNIEQQRALIPKQTEALIQQTEAAKGQAYEDILTGARRRGLGFSGIPLGEQAKYAAQVYAPAVLQARTQGQAQALSLEDSLNQLFSERLNRAEQIRQYETSQAEQQRQFNEQLAASRRAGGGGGGDAGNVLGQVLSALTGGGGGAAEQAKAFATQRANKGFDFTDVSGKAISAGKYAQLTGQGIGQVLYNMGKSGDTYAQNLYNQLKRDPFFGKGNAAYDAKIKQAYSPIFWGT